MNRFDLTGIIRCSISGLVGAALMFMVSTTIASETGGTSTAVIVKPGEIYQGLRFPAGTVLEISKNHWIKAATLSAEFNMNGYLLKQGTTLHISDSGTLRSLIAQEGQTINGVVFDKLDQVGFDSNGKLYLINTRKEHLIQGFVFSADYPVEFYPSGTIRSGLLTNESLLQNLLTAHHKGGVVKLAKSSNFDSFNPTVPAEFDQNGNLLSIELQSGVEIQGIGYGNDTVLEFYPSGAVKSGTLIAPTKINGVDCDAGKIHWTQSGNIQKCNLKLSAQEIKDAEVLQKTVWLNVMHDAPNVPGGLSLIAGSLSGAGIRDGVGSQAQFTGSTPFVASSRGITSDRAGNLYIAESTAHTIRKITKDGVVTTIAGKTYSSGNLDGVGDTARFNFPTGIVADSHGNLFVMDSGNSTLRKIAPGGKVTTLAGAMGKSEQVDGSGAAAHFGQVTSITISRRDVIYVLDDGYLRKVTPDGAVTTVRSDPTRHKALPGASITQPKGSSVPIQFMYAAGMTIDSHDVLYVADMETGYRDPIIRRVSANGTVTNLNVTKAAGNPRGCDLKSMGNVQVLNADQTDNLYLGFADKICKVTPAGIGSLLVDPDQYGRSFPYNYVFDNAGNLFEAADLQIRKISQQGSVTIVAGQAYGSGTADGIGGSARFEGPRTLASDRKGNLYVVEYARVRKVSVSGEMATVTTVAGSSGERGVGYHDGASLSAKFNNMTGIAVDKVNNLYIVDGGNKVIRKISVDGMVTTFAGTAGKSGHVDGTGSAARFNEPNQIAMDKAGNLFVTDRNTLRKIDRNGHVTTFVGDSEERSSKNGIGRLASFQSLKKLAFDKYGNLFVTDANLIRKIDARGKVTTIGNYADLVGGSGWLPDDLVVDDVGNVYFEIGDVIRKLTPAGVLTTVAGVQDRNGNETGILGVLNIPRGLVMLDSKAIALVSGAAVLKLTLP